MRLRHKPWADDLIKEHKDIALNVDDIPSLPDFNVLEVGSGCGGFILQMAEKFPEYQFLGAEVAETAFAIALKKMLGLEKVPTNVKFINTPIDTLIPAIKDNSLDRVYLNFSDPWPKKRHHKRRLTYPTRLASYFRILKDGGTLFFKTDNVDLYNDSKKYFEQFGQFKFTFIDEYKEVTPDDVASEYETKFRAKGVMIHKIIAVKEKR